MCGVIFLLKMATPSSSSEANAKKRPNAQNRSLRIAATMVSYLALNPCSVQFGDRGVASVNACLRLKLPTHILPKLISQDGVGLQARVLQKVDSKRACALVVYELLPDERSGRVSLSIVHLLVAGAGTESSRNITVALAYLVKKARRCGARYMQIETPRDHAAAYMKAGFRIASELGTVNGRDMVTMIVSVPQPSLSTPKAKRGHLREETMNRIFKARR